MKKSMKNMISKYVKSVAEKSAGSFSKMSYQPSVPKSLKK